VLRDKYRAAELIRRLELTPFARADFRDAYRPSRSQLEKARRLIVRSFMGFGNNPTRLTPRTGFRSATSQSGTTPAKDWSTYPEALWGVVERFNGVTIESKPALALIEQYDRDDVLIYADPPYVHATRPSFLERGARSDGYQFEMIDEEHVALLDRLNASSAMVMLSGYENGIYADRLSGWRRVQQRTHTDGGRERTEVLWLNPALVDRFGSGPLFEAAA
jgi:DNA adenine methylase